MSKRDVRPSNSSVQNEREDDESLVEEEEDRRGTKIYIGITRREMIRKKFYTSLDL